MYKYQVSEDVADEIHRALVDAGVDPRGTVEAVKSGDFPDRIRRLARSREIASHQWDLAAEKVIRLQEEVDHLRSRGTAISAETRLRVRKIVRDGMDEHGRSLPADDAPEAG